MVLPNAARVVQQPSQGGDGPGGLHGRRGVSAITNSRSVGERAGSGGEAVPGIENLGGVFSDRSPLARDRNVVSAHDWPRERTISSQERPLVHGRERQGGQGLTIESSAPEQLLRDVENGDDIVGRK